MNHKYYGMSVESQQRQSFLGNGSANTPVAKQWLSGRHVMAAKDTHVTIEELLEAAFSVRPVLSIFTRSSWGVSNLRRQNMVKRPAGLRLENDCAGESQEQL
jgi:hypothetical protein